MRAVQLGQRLRAARKRAGLEQQALAEKSGISRQTIRELERGNYRSSLALRTAEKLAKALGIPPADLVGW